MFLQLNDMSLIFCFSSVPTSFISAIFCAVGGLDRLKKIDFEYYCPLCLVSHYVADSQFGKLVGVCVLWVMEVLYDLGFVGELHMMELHVHH
jgi:hypothetical protein